jgi:hypothetical protein
MGSRRLGDSHSIINEKGGAWAVPDHMRMIPEQKHG